MSSEVMDGQMTIAGVQVSGASVTLSAIGKKELQVEGADALRTGDRIKIEAEFVIEDFGVHEKHDKLGFGTESPKLQFIAKPVHPSVKILDVQRRESLDEEWERGHGSPETALD